MKHDSIEHLLAKRTAGTLTDSELDELNRLTHKDEIVAAAERQAASIVRRRHVVVSVLATFIVLAGTGTFLLLPRQQAPLVAQQQPVATPVNEEIVTSPVESPAQIAAVQSTPAMETIQKHDKEFKQTTKTVQKPTDNSSTVVICNNQCEADSVINDIWKFLTA